MYFVAMIKADGKRGQGWVQHAQRHVRYSVLGSKGLEQRMVQSWKPWKFEGACNSPEWAGAMVPKKFCLSFSCSSPSATAQLEQCSPLLCAEIPSSAVMAMAVVHGSRGRLGMHVCRNQYRGPSPPAGLECVCWLSGSPF